MRNTVLTLVTAALVGGGLSAQTVELKFGVYTSDKPSVMYRMFLPSVEAVQSFMETRLKRDVEIDLAIFKSYEQAIDALVEGKVDFVRFGPASYVLAKERNPAISLLAMESKGGKKRFQGMIVVRKDSPIQTIKDLKGKKFAFGDPNSTIGRYLAQDVLARNDVFADSLSHFDYLGRHDKVFAAVELGDFHAGSLKSGTFKKMNKAGSLRILMSFPNVTKPWVARGGLDETIRDALSDSLISLADPEALKNLKCDGFIPTNDAEYAFVREGMSRAKLFQKSLVIKVTESDGKSVTQTEPGGN